MDKNFIDGLTQIISNLGFPVFVAIYLLWDGSKFKKQMTILMSELKGVIESTNKTLEKMDEKVTEHIISK